MRGNFVTLVCIFGYLGVTGGEPCQDIDTTSCQLIAVSKPDLCSDPNLANTACRAFCNLCDDTTTTSMPSSMSTTTLPTTMAPITTTAFPVCEDLDTSACQLIYAQRADLCSDPTLSRTCPRFCKICPVACYSCQTPVRSLNECKAKTLCNRGEVCIRTELKSSQDGHQEYVLGCAKSEACDGINLNLLVGRSVESRDLSVSCCRDDLCNNPAATTTTTPAPPTTTQSPSSSCAKDIFILLDETNSMERHEAELKNFIANIIRDIPVGYNDALVALETFNLHSTERWDINDYPDKQRLLNALSSVRFRGGSGDVDIALKYIVQHEADIGNRRLVPDVILLITDNGPRRSSLLHQLSNQVNQLSHDVIVLEINGIEEDVSSIATDKLHHLVGYTASLTPIEQQIVQLICN